METTKGQRRFASPRAGKDSPSAGDRKRAARVLRAAVAKQEARTVGQALRRLNPKHREYVMKRAEGQSRAQAYKEAISDTKRATDYARKIESLPHIQTALAAAEAAVVKGSLMTAAQRRDYVLDRLVMETTEGGDSARVRALELLGKTAGMFVDRQEVNMVGGASDIRTRLEQLINQVQSRTIDGESTLVDAATESIEAERLNVEGNTQPSIEKDPTSILQSESADPTDGASTPPNLTRSPTV